MGKRGPKPKPTGLRVFEGDPGRLLSKREGEPLPAGQPTVPGPPDWLGDIGREVWVRIAAVLHPIQLLTQADLNLLALYCEAWDEFFAAREVVASEGMTAVSAKGGVFQHPAVGIKNRAIARIRQIGGDFGLSPASRVGLKATSAPQDALAAFKKQG